MEALEGIWESEERGRGISSNKAARRLRNSRARHYDCLPREGEVEISVDRLSVAGLKQATATADTRDHVRGRTFYGWLVIVASEAAREGRRIVISSCRQSLSRRHHSSHARCRRPGRAEIPRPRTSRLFILAWRSQVGRLLFKISQGVHFACIFTLRASPLL